MSRLVTRLRRTLAQRTRMKPAFMIIGAQRGGTTSLYNYLCEHPRILPAREKEIHFFDKAYERGPDWYAAFFPSWLAHLGQRAITGEATPYYLFHPLAPERIHAHFPQMKLIVLLRNPVDRAYSHYQYQVRLGNEVLSFEDALAQESERLHGEHARIEAETGYNSFAHQKFSYLTRGVYVDALARWFTFFPRDQFLILKSEDFYADPPAVLRRTFAFLDVQDWTLNTFTPFNQARYDDMHPDTRARLSAHFAPHNQRLYALLGEDFGWEAAE